jgi:hypothetical protein
MIRRSRRITTVVLACILLIIGGVIFWQLQKNSDPDSSNGGPISSQNIPDSNNHDTEEDPTTPQNGKTSTSAPIPSNVSPESIKPYTLITENETYKIRELDGVYTVTLYAVINRPEQSSQYYEQLKQYKQDALDYLSGHSVDINRVRIQYEPQEATNL